MVDFKSKLESLEVPPIPESKIKLVIVPSERLPVDSKISKIKSEGKTYFIIDRFTFSKSDPHPNGMILLATGKIIDKETVWNKYRNSDKLYFYIIKE